MATNQEAALATKRRLAGEATDGSLTSMSSKGTLTTMSDGPRMTSRRMVNSANETRTKAAAATTDKEEKGAALTTWIDKEDAKTRRTLTTPILRADRTTVALDEVEDLADSPSTRSSGRTRSLMDTIGISKVIATVNLGTCRCRL